MLFCKRQPVSNENQPSPQGRKTFFIVTTREGLNLRAAPSVNAQVLTVLPFRHRGEIIEKGTKGDYIQNALGYWAKTQYNGKEGWVFSGFIWLLSSIDEKVQLPDSDMYEMNVGDSMQESSLERTAPPNLKAYKKIRNQIFGLEEYEVFLAKPISDLECDGVDLLFVAKNSKNVFQTKVIREFFKVRSPDNARFIVFEDVFGYCGCGGHLVFRTIYAGPEGLKTFSLDAPNQLKAGDFCPLFDGHTPAKNYVRLEAATNRLLVHSFTTNCRPTKDITNSRVNRFHSGYFTIFDFSASSLRIIDRTDSDDIPVNYQVLWKNLPPM